MRTKAADILQAAGRAARSASGTSPERSRGPAELTVDWFVGQRAEACREAGEPSDSHADLPVAAPAAPSETRAMLQGGSGSARG